MQEVVHGRKKRTGSDVQSIAKKTRPSTTYKKGARGEKQRQLLSELDSLRTEGQALTTEHRKLTAESAALRAERDDLKLQLEHSTALVSALQHRVGVLTMRLDLVEDTKDWMAGVRASGMPWMKAVVGRHVRGSLANIMELEEGSA